MKYVRFAAGVCVFAFPAVANFHLCLMLGLTLDSIFFVPWLLWCAVSGYYGGWYGAKIAHASR